jgi:hypothetical protein
LYSVLYGEWKTTSRLSMTFWIVQIKSIFKTSCKFFNTRCVHGTVPFIDECGIGTFAHSANIHSFISIQPYRPGWQKPEPSRVTGMALAHCILDKFLVVFLPLLSPAFRRSHFRCQVPVRPQRRERS